MEKHTWTRLTKARKGTGNPDVVPALLKVLSNTDTDQRVRIAAATALGQLETGNPDVVSALLKALSDANANVQRAAATALGQLGADNPDVVPALLKALSDADSRDVRDLTSDFDDPRNRQKFAAYASLISHIYAQMAAATALGQLGAGNPDVIPALLKALSNTDTHWQVRIAAATALGQLGAGNPDVVPALLKTLSDADANVQRSRHCPWSTKG